MIRAIGAAALVIFVLGVAFTAGVSALILLREALA